MKKSAELQDLRFSKQATGDWTEYLTKYSKGGTKTYLPQISGKLPTRKITNQDFLDIISSKTNLPQEEIDSAKNIINQINKTEESLKDFDKQLTTLDSLYAETNQEEQVEKQTLVIPTFISQPQQQEIQPEMPVEQPQQMQQVVVEQPQVVEQHVNMVTEQPQVVPSVVPQIPVIAKLDQE